MRFWAGIAAAAITPSACFVAMLAPGQGAQSKIASKREAPPYWAFAVNPEIGGSGTAAGADRAARHV
ncbi:MAG: hypothetical protein WBL63_26150, partial [Candidatus Acidiferrum sp.]